MTKIKICGLTSSQDIEYVNKYNPDFVGFVFAKKSKRYITPKAAAQLSSKLNSNIIPVGVFVDEKPEMVAGLLEQGVIRMAQLHGKEDEEYIRQLRLLTSGKISKAFSISCEDDLLAAASSSADYVLLDNGNGGTGQSFDWKLISRFQKPYFLAGGLSPENVSRAIDLLEPWAVDVSSGVETNGKKDPLKIDEFIKEVR